MTEVPEHILAWRRTTGADRYDEVWEGVLHMAPVPSNEHQRVRDRLLIWLATHWAQPPHREAMTEVNTTRPGTADWCSDYRVPDLSLFTESRTAIDRGTHFEGAADVVVEIRSPQDETDSKLGFYAAAGCREIWVIDRDTRAVRICKIADGALAVSEPDREGFLRSVLGLELRTRDDRLEIRIASDPSTTARLP